MAATPIPIELSVVGAAKAAEAALALGENLLNIVLPNFFDLDIEIALEVGTSAGGALEAAKPTVLRGDRLESRDAGQIAQRARAIDGGVIALAADAARFKQDLEQARARLAALP